ncbi:hypothetical protein ACFVW2_33475 [Streptomyces sp. NPDC058171]
MNGPRASDPGKDELSFDFVVLDRSGTGTTYVPPTFQGVNTGGTYPFPGGTLWQQPVSGEGLMIGYRVFEEDFGGLDQNSRQRRAQETLADLRGVFTTGAPGDAYNAAQSLLERRSIRDRPEVEDGLGTRTHFIGSDVIVGLGGAQAPYLIEDRFGTPLGGQAHIRLTIRVAKGVPQSSSR